MCKILTVLDFKPHCENIISFFALIFSVIFVKFYNLAEIFENTTLENTQLIFLFAGFVACFFAKKNKTLFNFVAMVLFLMFMREISYGRVFIDETQIVFNKHLAHTLVGVYIGIGALYALVKKIWVDIIDIFKRIKFPVWTFLGCVISVLLQLISEEFWHNSVIEETAELVLYAFIFAFVLIYLKQNKNN